jgi:hypothetical protein
MEPYTEVLYKTTDYYSPQHDAGVYWDDVALGISWPVTATDAVVSNKDSLLPRFADWVSPTEPTQPRAPSAPNPATLESV